MAKQSIMQSVRRQATDLLVTGSRFKGFDQVRQRHMWSSYWFHHDANGYIAAGDFDVFNTPPGQIGQGIPLPITLFESNWQSANRIPDNQNFVVTELGCMLRPVPAAYDAQSAKKELVPFCHVANQVVNNTIVSIQYLTNAIPLGYCSDFAQAAGPTVGNYVPYEQAAEGETRTMTYFNTNGFPGPGLRRRFKVPILLQHGETFSFRFSVPRSYYAGAWDFLLRLDFWATESFVEKS